MALVAGTRAPLTRERILEAAETLFLARGFAGTAVDDVCTAADSSKGSFYHHFESKEALALAVLDAYYARGLTRLMSGPFHREADPIKRCLAFLRHAEDISVEVWSEGCILGSFAADLADSSPRVHGAVANRLKNLAAALAPLFAAALAQQSARPRRPTADDLAHQFLAVVEGAIVLAKAHRQPPRIAAGIRSYRQVLEGFMTA